MTRGEGEEKRREREEGGRDLGEQCYKSSSMQKRKCRKRKKVGIRR